MRRLLAAAAAALCASVLLAAPAHAEGRDWTGQAAPEIYVQQGLYGLPSGVTLQSMRGRPVVIKFFFAACPVCRETMPEFDRMYRRYAARGVQFIAFAFDNRWTIESMWRQSGYAVPVAIDENGVTPGRFGVSTYPTTYVIGPDGVVRSYDVLTDGVLERELARSPLRTSTVGGAGTAPAVSTAYAPGGAAPSAPSVVGAATLAEANVRELGDVPAALAGVQEAARQNDYGTVLRIVEHHRDPTKDDAAVVVAADRIARIALERHERRKQRIRDRWALGDQRGAYEQVVAIAADFRDTSVEASLRDWANRVRADLVARGVLVAGR